LHWLSEQVHHVASVATRYHVSAPILVTIYLVSIPVFWIALALAVKEAVRLRRQGLPYRGQRLSLSLLVLALAWLSPYLYVVIQGRNLPWFVWTLLGVLVLVTGWRPLRTVRNRVRAKARQAGLVSRPGANTVKAKNCVQSDRDGRALPEQPGDPAPQREGD
jgi:hypothetical protein